MNEPDFITEGVFRPDVLARPHRRPLAFLGFSGFSQLRAFAAPNRVRRRKRLARQAGQREAFSASCRVEFAQPLSVAR